MSLSQRALLLRFIEHFEPQELLVELSDMTFGLISLAPRVGVLYVMCLRKFSRTFEHVLEHVPLALLLGYLARFEPKDFFFRTFERVLWCQKPSS